MIYLCDVTDRILTVNYFSEGSLTSNDETFPNITETIYLPIFNIIIILIIRPKFSPKNGEIYPSQYLLGKTLLKEPSHQIRIAQKWYDCVRRGWNILSLDFEKFFFIFSFCSKLAFKVFKQSTRNAYRVNCVFKIASVDKSHSLIYPMYMSLI
jgi:hypothetical protein